MDIPKYWPIPKEWDDLRGHARYKQLLSYAMELHAQKGADYSGTDRDSLTNLRQAKDLGISPFVGVLVRMSDKWERIKSLVRDGRTDQPKVTDESILDTLFDLSAYALLAYILYEEEVDVRRPITPDGRFRLERVAFEQNIILTGDGSPTGQEAVDIASGASDCAATWGPESWAGSREVPSATEHVGRRSS
jgi:hypothetical protein